MPKSKAKSKTTAEPATRRSRSSHAQNAARRQAIQSDADLLDRASRLIRFRGETDRRID